ncbi:MAG: hypothetical protein ACKV19_18330 [Verrucomicrobiales bacterium]
MKRHIIALLALGVALPILSRAEVAGESHRSPDKALLVMVERTSEQPHLSVTLLDKPARNSKNTLWHQHLSISPSDAVQVWWRADSKAFIVQHTTKDKQIRLFAVIIGQDTIACSEVPAAQLSDVKSIDADTIVWKKDGAIELEGETSEGRSTLRVSWSCSLKAVKKGEDEAKANK